MMTTRLVSIKEAAQALGVSIPTLRRWEANGMLPAAHTAGGHRRYDLTKIRREAFAEDEVMRHTVAYASVSSSHFGDDLECQKRALELYCSSQGWMFEIVSDIGLGKGKSYREQEGLQRLLRAITDGQVERLVLMRKERLPRLETELVFAVCAAKHVEVVVLNWEDTRVTMSAKGRKPWSNTAPASFVSQPAPLEPEPEIPASAPMPMFPGPDSDAEKTAGFVPKAEFGW